MLKLLAWFIEAVFWFLLFLAPVLGAAFVALICVAQFGLEMQFALAIVGCGMVAGVLFAEKVRKKHGCSTYYSFRHL